jgi:biopolymer transport protein ExbD
LRRPSPFTQRRDPVDIKMTPMIDVVFLLMIYFIWSSSFGVPERLLPSDVAAESSGAGSTPSELPPPKERDFEKIIVRIVAVPGGVAWRINDAPVASLGELQSRLQPIVRIKRDAPVVLHPDPEVPLGDVIDVFDMSRLIGFEKVQFAVNAK